MNIEEARMLYERYAAGVAYIEVMNSHGDFNIGTAYHIGDGIFITARHVIEGKTITKIATNVNHWDHIGRVVGNPFFHPDPSVDVAAIKVEGISAPVIPIGSHLDDWLGNDFTLETVLIMGYPPIPFSSDPILVANLAVVNAVIDKYTGGHPHFILSAMARGGFSGGPAITRFNFSLGIITESLGTYGQTPEQGYFAVLSVEPIYKLLSSHKIMPDFVKEGWDGLWDEDEWDIGEWD